ncbi:MAG: S8 family serine peptidase, partial [Deltaproteobacteria bacterium]|nr:S8 family serine peptidase [Deltaproteobacteria bacterium]
DITVPPNDPRYPGQWYLDHIGIEDAWSLSTGNASTTVVVVDNGCDLTHPDLVARLDPGYDVFDQDDDPSFLPGDTGNEHGTACAGIVGAQGDNGIGIAGACPECRVRCVRLLGPPGSLIPISSDVQAFDLSNEWGAAVVSNSWGFEEGLAVPAAIARAMESLYDEGRGGLGSLVVFAAGNDARELDPSEITGVRGVVTVGAINNFDEATSFSNSGRDVDVTAPTGTLTTDIQGAEGENATEYTSLFGGTSSSCPVVAGAAALLFAAAPDATAERVGTLLSETARPAPFATPDADGHDLVYGYGIVDPAPALRALLGLPGPGEDAGPPPVEDAGSEVDSGGEPDSGSIADSGAIDSGPIAPRGESDDGCGCGVVGRSNSWSARPTPPPPLPIRGEGDLPRPPPRD